MYRALSVRHQDIGNIEAKTKPQAVNNFKCRMVKHLMIISIQCRFLLNQINQPIEIFTIINTFNQNIKISVT